MGTMLVKRGTVEGVGVRLGLSEGNEESLEEVSQELVERRKLDFGLPLDEAVVTTKTGWRLLLRLLLPKLEWWRNWGYICLVGSTKSISLVGSTKSISLV